MSKGNENVYPQMKHFGDIGKSEGGLTKREYFSSMALQGFLSAPDLTLKTYEDIAIHCLKAADALLAALEELK